MHADQCENNKIIKINFTKPIIFSVFSSINRKSSNLEIAFDRLRIRNRKKKAETFKKRFSIDKLKIPLSIRNERLTKS